MIGNIFYSYKEIDANGELFKSWVELTGPVWEMLGSKVTDIIAMKRWLAFLEGGLLPVISLTSLHFFTKYDAGKSNNDEVTEVIIEEEIPTHNEVDEITSEVNLSQDEQPIIPEEPKFISPGMDTQEPPRLSRLSYVKPQS